MSQKLEQLARDASLHGPCAGACRERDWLDQPKPTRRCRYRERRPHHRRGLAPPHAASPTRSGRRWPLADEDARRKPRPVRHTWSRAAIGAKRHPAPRRLSWKRALPASSWAPSIPNPLGGGPRVQRRLCGEAGIGSGRRGSWKPGVPAPSTRYSSTSCTTGRPLVVAEIRHDPGRESGHAHEGHPGGSPDPKRASGCIATGTGSQPSWWASAPP